MRFPRKTRRYWRALQNSGYSVGIESLGSIDTIASAVQKGNADLLRWMNEEIKTLGEEAFLHGDFAATLKAVLEIVWNRGI